jgi:5-methylcytosine-specific restriction endonuclease McrA
LFLPGLALLQSPGTKYLVAWLVFIRFVGWACHQWSTSAIPPKASHQCDARREDLKICTSQVNINGSTTLQLHHQLPSSFCWSEGQGEWRHQQLWPTMTLGWIGITPSIVRC